MDGHREIPLTEDLLGFCEGCFRMRWLRWLQEQLTSPAGPTGTCRSCAREPETRDFPAAS